MYGMSRHKMFSVELGAIDARSKFLSDSNAAMLSSSATYCKSDEFLSFAEISLANALEESDIAIKKFPNILSSQNGSADIFI